MRQAHYAQQLTPLLRPAAGYAYSLLRNRDDAQDAVQQAALRGLERLHTYDDTRSFRQWWFAVLRNCCIDIVRADRRALHVSVDEFADKLFELEDAQPVEWEDASAEHLNRAIDQLSADHQEILRLKYFAELSYKELGAVLGIPQGTVMSRLHLARISLVSRMKEQV